DRAAEERKGDNTRHQPELPDRGVRDPRLGNQWQAELAVVAEYRIDRRPEQQRRQEVEHPRDEARDRTDDERKPVFAAVDSKQPPHRVFRSLPLITERVVLIIE